MTYKMFGLRWFGGSDGFWVQGVGLDDPGSGIIKLYIDSNSYSG
jgi:hypothetical protein